MDNLTQAEFGDIMGQVTSEEDFMSAVLMIYANGRGETVVDVGLRQLPAAAPAGDPYSTRVRNAINVLSGLETLGNRGLEQGTLRQENLEEVFQNTIESPEFTNPARILGNAGFTIEPEITEGNGPNADEGRISFTVTDPNQEGAMSMSVLAERITPLAQDEFAIEQETIANLDQLFPRQDDGSNTDAQLNYLVDLDLNMDVMHTLVGEWSGGGLGIEDDEAVSTREVFARYDIDPQETLDAFNNLTEEEQVEFLEAGDGREAFMEQVLMLTVPLEEAGLGDAPLRIPRLGTAPAAPAAQKELPVKWKEHAGADLILQTKHITNSRELEIIVPRPEGATQNFYSTHWPEDNVAFHIRFHDTALPDGSKVLFLDEIQSDLAKAAKGDSDHISAFKDWPFVKNYTESALRRMVRWAAESGQYDSIGWTTGAQQVERYETATRRRVDSLNWRWDPEDQLPLQISVIKDNQPIKMLKFDWNSQGKFVDADGNTLQETIGEEQGNKLQQVAIENEAMTQYGIIDSEDLTIGDTGMKAYYDKIIPNTMNKLFGKKSLGGSRAHITKIEMGGSSEPKFIARPESVHYEQRTLAGRELHVVSFDHASLSSLGLGTDNFVFESFDAAVDFTSLIGSGLTNIEEVLTLEDNIVSVVYTGLATGPKSMAIKFPSEIEALAFSSDLETSTTLSSPRKCKTRP
jgi:hypothetical protein